MPYPGQKFFLWEIMKFFIKELSKHRLSFVEIIFLLQVMDKFGTHRRKRKFDFAFRQGQYYVDL
jgi:hypothetical protein